VRVPCFQERPHHFHSLGKLDFEYAPAIILDHMNFVEITTTKICAGLNRMRQSGPCSIIYGVKGASVCNDRDRFVHVISRDHCRIGWVSRLNQFQSVQLSEGIYIAITVFRVSVANGRFGSV